MDSKLGRVRVVIVLIAFISLVVLPLSADRQYGHPPAAIVIGESAALGHPPYGGPEPDPTRVHSNARKHTPCAFRASLYVQPGRRLALKSSRKAQRRLSVFDPTENRLKLFVGPGTVPSQCRPGVRVVDRQRLMRHSSSPTSVSALIRRRPRPILRHAKTGASGPRGGSAAA